MSVIKPSDLVGIDKRIGEIQDSIFSYLSTKWDGTIDIYGRVYEVQTKDGSDLQVRVNKEFKQIFCNDKISATVGVRTRSKQIVMEGKYNATVQVIFTGNCKKTLVEDEQVFLDAHDALELSMLCTNIKNPKLGVAEVFTGIKNDKLKYGDLYPNFVFSIDCDITYFNN